MMKIKNSLLHLIFKIKSILALVYTKANISKIIIIFSVGLLSRIIVNYIYSINVFTDYLNSISLIYFSFMSVFIVFVQ